MQFKDYYDTLGVKPDASEADIKTAYRRLARKYHPDVSKEAGAEDRFKGINEAYEALRDPQRRAAYDQLRARGYRAGQEYQPPGGFQHPGGFEFDFGEGGEGGGFSDFFESLFGRARARGAGPERRPPDDVAQIEIDLETAYHGGAQRVRIGERTLDVKIPKGIQPGQQIRLAGQGRQGRDLRLEIGYRADPRFRVEGRNVIHALAVTPWEAALGAEIAVPTLAGEVNVRVPAGSDGGKRLRLRGRGLPGAAGQADGDQVVELVIRVPPAQTPAQENLYRQMAETFRFDPRRP
ncbi:MAG: DnaJ C-terminal domain-containing protein [Lysobacteraceae bacterium]